MGFSEFRDSNPHPFEFSFCFLGECKSIPDCEEGELEDFPRRMREWLFNVMEELAGRGKLTPHFSKLHKEGEVCQSYSRAKPEIYCYDR